MNVCKRFEDDGDVDKTNQEPFEMSTRELNYRADMRAFVGNLSNTALPRGCLAATRTAQQHGHICIFLRPILCVRYFFARINDPGRNGHGERENSNKKCAVATFNNI